MTDAHINAINLASWAPDSAVFTELARLSGWHNRLRSGRHTITPRAAAALWSGGRCNADQALFVALHCEDPELLARMFRRERRVTVRARLAANVHLPLREWVEALAPMDFNHRERLIADRTATMGATELVDLAVTSATDGTAEFVAGALAKAAAAHHDITIDLLRQLSTVALRPVADALMRPIFGKDLSEVGMLADELIANHPLDEVVGAAVGLVGRCTIPALEALMARLEDVPKAPRVCGPIIAAVAGRGDITEALAQRIADRFGTDQLVRNRHVPISVIEGGPATAGAVGRALAERGCTDPQSWILAAQLLVTWQGPCGDLVTAAQVALT